MKYTQEMSDKLVKDYAGGRSVEEMAIELDVPKRSVIAKLSSLGVYKAKSYVNKRGEQPIKKEQYILRLATLLKIDVNLLDSMEKVTKTALTLLEESITDIKVCSEAEIAYWKDEAALLEEQLQKYENETVRDPCHDTDWGSIVLSPTSKFHEKEYLVRTDGKGVVTEAVQNLIEGKRW